jgi:NodT family efflux transporter outer membrane factor (OMF) lipoprotein
MMKKHATAAALAALLAGCAAGPAFMRPAAPGVQGYAATPLPEQTVSADTPGGAAQHFIVGQDAAPDWWTAFGSAALDRLVAEALAHNPDLQAADAALRAARESAAAQGGVLWPALDLHLQPTRQRVAAPLASPTAAGNNLYTLHTAQLNVGYSLDVFGGARRQVEAAGAQADVARFQRDAARLTLAANVAQAAINEAALRAQLDAMRQLAASARLQLDAVRKQQHAGQVSAAEVAAQEALLAQADAGLPALEKQLAQQASLLAVLAGRMPSEDAGARPAFDELRLPEQLPLSVPARLVEQRPDVRAAEAQLHAASAQVGVARAARLPDIALTAALGSSALSGATLFHAGTGFWSIGADLVQPLFKGGALAHRQRAAEAGYEQAAAQYRSVVLAAFRDVADTLQALEADARALRAAVTAEQAAGRSLAITQRQRQLGAVAYPAVLQAEQAYRQTVITLVQARATRYADTVALFQALGGGWRE